ncbi:MAG: HAMP domain-containing sensor histidine kinase [Cyanobacteria bacterium]|nr:HAMP domain-containing sensor histidine kinase [Cyanobacteriota bacterium]MDA0864901.1 HAMP domain-containing sensor histidine kinase [Cyanobacteriota bacterium]
MPAPASSPTSTAYYKALELALFRGGFLARTSHELRSPLSKIISMHQMILEGLCDSREEETEFLAEAHGAALKLLEHLDFLIYLSKLEGERLHPEGQWVALAPLFEKVQSLTHLQAANRNLCLVLAPPADPMKVWADPAWLSTVLVTLIEVAIETCDRGTIRIALAPKQPAGSCDIWVEDERPGGTWQEPCPLPDPEDFDLERSLPMSLRLELVRLLLTRMGGAFSLISTPAAAASGPTRVLCRLPLAAPQDPD